VTSGDFQSRLMERFALEDFVPAPQLVDRLETYYELLATWNRKINLSGMSLSEPTQEALDRLLVEPVVASRYAASGSTRIIDIGSGGGSPAIPFALAVPDSQVLMVESKARKSVFLNEALRALRMAGSAVVTSRFEDLRERQSLSVAHDILTVRAVRVRTEDLELLQALVRPGGQMLLFRGGTDIGSVLPDGLQLTGAYPLVKALQSQLVVLAKLR
jgi:16S rRNA (guanine527-N7)-methyltransferase